MERYAGLSKSLFARGLQCRKSLYLHRYRPELRREPTPELEALWAAGREVGDLARMLFPGGVVIPHEGLSRARQLEATRQAIAQGTKAIYEAAFLHEGVFVKADILVRERGAFRLYEVKNATLVEEHFWDDAAIQYYVLSGSRIPLDRAFLVHVNNSYVRNGDVDPEELFVVQDITGMVREKQRAIPETLDEFRAVLRGDEPDIDIGPHCESPHACDFIPHCWRHVPAHSVFSLRGRGADRWELYRQGILDLADVPVDALNPMQRMQVEYFRDRKAHTDPVRIREFLGRIGYPVCFLDFETFGSAIPRFDGTRPYQQVPFQYSMHRVDAEDAPAAHFEYLADPDEDPREAIALGLLAQIPEGACVLAYNVAFEKRVLRELGDALPRYRTRLNAVAEGMVDLMEPFRRRDIYHWKMGGSYSLKAVLPALVPGVAYDGLAIRDGAMASNAFLALGEIRDPVERARLREALRDYCRQDTLGLVHLVDAMRKRERT